MRLVCDKARCGTVGASESLEAVDCRAPVVGTGPDDLYMLERKYEERWFESGAVGDASRERSGDEILEVLDAPVEASESSNDLVDEADETDEAAGNGDEGTGCMS